MIVNSKEAASLLLLEFAFGNHPAVDKISKETEGGKETFSGEYLDNYLPRLEAYISANRDAFISLQKKAIKYLKGMV